MAPKLYLYLFGAPQFIYRGSPVTGFVSNKARALLIYLAVTKRPHSRNALAELLWADTPTTARQNLKSALGNLRKLAGVVLLESEDHLISLEQRNCWVDVAVFTEMVDPLADQDVDTLQQAVQLYQADFLNEFNISVSYEFEAWALGEQQRLKTALTKMLYRLAELHEQGDNLTAAIDALQQLLQIESWREEAHRQVMLLLVRNGDRSGALRQFDLCREALAAELDIEPDPQTIALLEAIRKNELQADSSSQQPSVIRSVADQLVLPGKPHLPPLTPTFMGREKEVTEVTRLLTKSDARLITILSAGGMGKTQLALAVAESVAAEQPGSFPDGIYWIALVSLTQPEEITFAIGEALKFSFRGEHSPQEQLCAFLKNRRLLLVMDNMEHLLDGVSLITDILTSAPQVSLLITSRERLHLAHETVFFT